MVHEENRPLLPRQQVDDQNIVSIDTKIQLLK